MAMRQDALQRHRLGGIDIARALAIMGMLAVHVGPTRQGDLAGRIYAELFHGRASILFCLVAGVGVSLLAASARRAPMAVRARLVWTAAVLFPLGLWLQSLDINVLVILPHYAALFAIGALAIGLSTRALASLAGIMMVAGPVTYWAGRILDPPTFARSPVDLNDAPLEMVQGVFISGPYPVLTWVAPFLVGMVLGRLDLTRTGAAVRLVLLGSVVAVSAAGVAVLAERWGTGVLSREMMRLVTDRPHSQMPLWLIGSTGSALLALGLSLFFARWMGRLAWPIIAPGQLALTIYAGHLLAFHWTGRTLIAADVEAAVGIVAAILVVASVFAMAWRSVLARGPLEMIVALPDRLFLVRDRGRPAGAAAPPPA